MFPDGFCEICGEYLSSDEEISRGTCDECEDALDAAADVIEHRWSAMLPGD